MRTHPSAGRIGLLALSIIALAAIPACNETDRDVIVEEVVIAPEPEPEGHPDIVLRDAQGEPLALGSQEPYSPRWTCGACHNVDLIANGYHFQQGRTDLNGYLLVQNDFFDDGRDFVLSAGMYGKW